MSRPQQLEAVRFEGECYVLLPVADTYGQSWEPGEREEVPIERFEKLTKRLPELIRSLRAKEPAGRVRHRFPGLIRLYFDLEPVDANWDDKRHLWRLADGRHRVEAARAVGVSEVPGVTWPQLCGHRLEHRVAEDWAPVDFGDDPWAVWARHAGLSLETRGLPQLKQRIDCVANRRQVAYRNGSYPARIEQLCRLPQRIDSLSGCIGVNGEDGQFGSLRLVVERLRSGSGSGDPWAWSTVSRQSVGDRAAVVAERRAARVAPTIK